MAVLVRMLTEAHMGYLSQPIAVLVRMLTEAHMGYLSQPMAVLVRMLTEAHMGCRNNTRGHITSPNIQYPSIDFVKLKMKSIYKSMI